MNQTTKQPRDKWGKIQREVLPLIKKPRDLNFYSCLVTYANDKSQCYPAVNTIAEDIGISPSNVRACLNSLEGDGWIKRTPRVNSSNMYQIYFVDNSKSDGRKKRKKEKKIEQAPKTNIGSPRVPKTGSPPVPKIGSQIDHTLIDQINKPITNLSGAGFSNSEIIKRFDDCEIVFNTIKSINYENGTSNDWQYNEKDRQIIQRAIRKEGLVKVIEIVMQRFIERGSEICDVSFVFQELVDYKDLCKVNPNFAIGLSKTAFNGENLEDVILEQNAHFLYEYIKSRVVEFHTPAVFWVSSDKDIEQCEVMLQSEWNFELEEKLGDGLKSAFTKNKWTFNQIVYQAIAAIKTQKEQYS